METSEPENEPGRRKYTSQKVHAVPVQPPPSGFKSVSLTANPEAPVEHVKQVRSKNAKSETAAAPVPPPPPPPPLPSLQQSPLLPLTSVSSPHHSESFTSSAPIYTTPVTASTQQSFRTPGAVSGL